MGTMRATLLLIALLPLASWAQAPLTREPDADGRKNQKIERLHHEDAGSTIDEVRVGGQVQSVTVQPKAGVPAYELPPNDMARSRPSDGRDGMAERRQRVWNFLNF
jgi:starvation-inducible outer membrane lipoprotein